jgi:hypothetical protein
MYQDNRGVSTDAKPRSSCINKRKKKGIETIALMCVTKYMDCQWIVKKRGWWINRSFIINNTVYWNIPSGMWICNIPPFWATTTVYWHLVFPKIWTFSLTNKLSILLNYIMSLSTNNTSNHLIVSYWTKQTWWLYYAFWFFIHISFKVLVMIR